VANGDGSGQALTIELDAAALEALQRIAAERGLEPAALVRQLRLSGAESRVLFLTRVADRPYVLIGQPAG